MGRQAAAARAEGPPAAPAAAVAPAAAATAAAPAEDAADAAASRSEELLAAAAAAPVHSGAEAPAPDNKQRPSFTSALPARARFGTVYGSAGTAHARLDAKARGQLLLEACEVRSARAALCVLFSKPFWGAE
jgi:hypothetical protein